MLQFVIEMVHVLECRGEVYTKWTLFDNGANFSAASFQYSGISVNLRSNQELARVLNLTSCSSLYNSLTMLISNRLNSPYMRYGFPCASFLCRLPWKSYWHCENTGNPFIGSPMSLGLN